MAYINNLWTTLQPVNTQIWISRRLSCCTKVIPSQVSHQLTCSFTWYNHNLKNLESQHSIYFKMFITCLNKWPRVLLKESFLDSLIWLLRLWISLQMYFKMKEKNAELLLNQSLMLSKTIFSQMITIIFKTELISYLNKNNNQYKTNNNQMHNKIQEQASRFKAPSKAMLIKIKEVTYSLERSEQESMPTSNS